MKKVFSLNIVLLFVSQIINVIGDDIFNLAIQWNVYEFSTSLIYSSLISVVWHVTDAVIAPIAGIVADKFNKRRVVLLTNITAFIYSLGLSFYSYKFNGINIVIVLISIIVLNILTSFITPIRTSLLVSQCKDNTLIKVNALFNSATQIASIFSGFIVGAVLGFGDISFAIFINSFTYLVVVICLMLFRYDLQDLQTDSNAKLQKVISFKEIKNGLDYIVNRAVLKKLTLFLMLINLGSFSGSFFAPFVYEKFNGNAQFYGTCQVISTVAMIVGMLVLTKVNLKSSKNSLKLSIITLGLCTLINCFVKSEMLFSLVLFVQYFSMGLMNCLLNTFLLENIEQSHLGRITGLIKSFTIILIPVTTLIAGLFGNMTNIFLIFIINGLYFVLISLFL